eukprot:272887_1
MSTLQKVSPIEMRFAAGCGLIAVVLWQVAGALFIAEWNVSEDVQTVADIKRFHKIMSSQKEKLEITSGCFLLYCSIPFSLYHIHVSSRYLVDYFGGCCPWASSFYTWLSLISIIILWNIIVPCSLLVVVLYNWDIEDTTIGYYIQLQLFYFATQVTSVTSLLDAIRTTIPWLSILILMWKNKMSGNRNQELLQLLFPLKGTVGLVSLMIFAIFNFFMLLIPSFAWGKSGFFSAGNDITYVLIYSAFVPVFNCTWMIWVSRNVKKINETINSYKKAELVQ